MDSHSAQPRRLPELARLRTLPLNGLRELAEELRQIIIATCLGNGGHLGASLGTVELAIALHRCFKSPDEPLVWDVGHQAYAHKLLTGRAERFNTLRTTGGISGFLSREESSHDVFGAGHSSTSLSAAMAMAWARASDPEDARRWTVAIIGDGGMTAGVALEALNNLRALSLGPLLILLNDNQMSISPNVGAIPAILSSGKAKEFFEAFDVDYIGPVDGHDLQSLIGLMESLKSRPPERPVILHALTQKGKGYLPAEESPAFYHGISPIPQKLPESSQSSVSPSSSFSQVFGLALCKLAEHRPEIVAITAAMPEGTGLTGFSQLHADRFFDVGIAEPHAVTFAAGLATQGYRPVVAIYSTFLQRGLDAIIHDVALQDLPVVFAIDRAGLVGPDGPTHHGAFDLAYLGAIPGLQIYCPSVLSDVPDLLKKALDHPGPCAIRYPRGSASATDSVSLTDGIRWHFQVEQPSAIVIALGAASSKGLKVRELLSPAERARCTFMSCVQAKPIPVSLIQVLRENPRARVLVLEEGSIRGGFGQALISESGARSGAWFLAGYPDRFIPHGSLSSLEEEAGISIATLLQKLRELLACI